MAEIDPEMQRRLDAVVLHFGEACKRFREAAAVAAYEMQILAMELEPDMKEAAATIADKAIACAKAFRSPPA